jgi:polyhydroxyalkanoate synthesis regulator phasin
MNRARIRPWIFLVGIALTALPAAISAQTRPVDEKTVVERVDAALATVSMRIETAVENGRLTREEGEEKLRQARADLIWKAALSMDPDQWPEPLQALILELRPGATIEQFAQWAREQQQKTAERDREQRIWAAAMAQDPSEWSDRLKAALLELKPDSTIEEIAEGVRQRQQHMELREQLRDAVKAGEMTPEEARQRLQEAREQMGDRDDRLAALRRSVIERALAEDPDQWNQDLLDAIARAGWDADALAERIRTHRARGDDDETTTRELTQRTPNGPFNTSVQTQSWSQIKTHPRD